MKYIKTFEELFEAKRKINQKNYEFYIVYIETNKIVEGFEYKEDASERTKEYIEESDKDLKGKLKIYSKKTLISKGIDPNDNENWKGI